MSTKKKAAALYGRKGDTRRFFLYLSPWLAGFLIFTAYPFLYSIYLSFTNITVSGSGVFVGLENYIRSFTREALFYKAFGNSLHYVAVYSPISIIMGLLIAIMLNRKLPGINFFRGAYFMPYITAGVAVTMLWKWIFNPTYGIVNFLLSLLGIPGPPWLNSPDWAMNTIIIINLWNIGNIIIIFLAALQEVPAHLYESALLDGASALKSFIHITLPMISPKIYFNLVMTVIFSFQMFTQPYVLTGGLGGPQNSTHTFMLYIFNTGFKYSEMGYASTLAWILFIVIMFFTKIFNLTSRFWVFEE
ncbi:multiple sugar transport system permease protein [Pillotina sp. SPG140]|jgi:multiple sugar transport system permease protein